MTDIDFEDLNWGSFTRTFQGFLRQHPCSKIKSLQQFANYVIDNKQSFSPKTTRRASFYINIILKKQQQGGGLGNDVGRAAFDYFWPAKTPDESASREKSRRFADSKEAENSARKNYERELAAAQKRWDDAQKTRKQKDEATKTVGEWEIINHEDAAGRKISHKKGSMTWCAKCQMYHRQNHKHATAGWRVSSIIPPLSVSSNAYNNYPSGCQIILDKFGDQTVRHLELKRSILSPTWTSLMHTLSLGKTAQKMKEMNIDQLFHLSLWIHLSNGVCILVEKRARLNFQVNPKPKKKEEKLQVPVSSSFTFATMMQKTRDMMGDSKFFTYNVATNNCSVFVSSILKANHILTSSASHFIDQDAVSILKGFDWIRDIANNGNVSIANINALLGGSKSTQNKVWDGVKWVSKKLEPFAPAARAMAATAASLALAHAFQNSGYALPGHETYQEDMDDMRVKSLYNDHSKKQIETQLHKPMEYFHYEPRNITATTSSSSHQFADGRKKKG